MKFLEDNVGENLYDLGYGNDFLDTAPKAWSMKKKLICWSSLTFKATTVQKTMSGGLEASSKGLLSKIHKEL